MKHDKFNFNLTIFLTKYNYDFDTCGGKIGREISILSQSAPTPCLHGRC